jgi:hypothetical protein
MIQKAEEMKALMSATAKKRKMAEKASRDRAEKGVGRANEHRIAVTGCDRR